MDSRHDFTLEKVFWGYFGALDQKANSALTPHAPRPHNKANLCCTKLRLAGCEPHMSGRNPFYLLKIFLLTAEGGRVE